MLAGGECGDSGSFVQIVRQHDVDRVEICAGECFVEGSKGQRAGSSGHLCGALRISVDDRRHARAGSGFTQPAQMVLRDAAAAIEREAQFGCTHDAA